MSTVIEPGRLLGVLGGGQLGAMFTAAAQRLGYRVAVWDPDPDAPAHRTADRSVPASFLDPAGLAAFRSDLEGVTYEWENVPVSLAEELEAAVPVRPAARILRLIQNRLTQKTFLLDRGFPVARFCGLTEPGQIRRAAEQIGYPCLCKTATFGYDGKGQWRLTHVGEAAILETQLPPRAGEGSQWILEEFVPFEKELSVLVVRGADEYRTYPVVENIHEGGILRMTCVPATVAPNVACEAQRLAASVVEALQGLGVFCVELFLMADGRLLINEIAPRPHNSGHYTLDACTTSQFEQQVRALCGLPLGEVVLTRPAVMVNLIGEDLARVINQANVRDLLRTPGAKLHVYGKRTMRPGRKMGHVTFLAEDPEEALRNAHRLEHALKERPGTRQEP
ncbi:5-(carboxyamino)imidazole ribonucleotide synthase [Candidatus Nitrospira bockiana]